jgi:hypothetical protein
MMSDRPRIRANKRRVAEGDEHSEFHDVDMVYFDDTQWHAISTSLLPGPAYNEMGLRKALEDIATSYVNNRRQPPAPKALIRRSLEQMAEAAGAAKLGDLVGDEKLRMQLVNLPDRAMSALWAAAEGQPDNPWQGPALCQLLPNNINWDAIARYS